MNADLKTAKQLGEEAQKRGDSRVPMFDRKLNTLLKNHHPVIRILLTREYLRGYDEQLLKQAA